MSCSGTDIEVKVTVLPPILNIFYWYAALHIPNTHTKFVDEAIMGLRKSIDRVPTRKDVQALVDW